MTLRTCVYNSKEFEVERNSFFDYMLKPITVNATF